VITLPLVAVLVGTAVVLIGVLYRLVRRGIVRARSG